MTPTPQREEIDPRTLKLIVGVIAISLAILTSAFSSHGLRSISESYYENGWSHSIFIGFLFAIASFLLAYNGVNPKERRLSLIAAVAALGVALFPCDCGHDPNVVPYLHGLSAAAMFIVLAYFCRAFYGRAREKARTKGYKEADRRAVIYVISGGAIVLSIAVLALDFALDHRLSAGFPALTFWGETVALVAFGIAWLTASKCLPGLAGKDEHFSPLRADNPPA